MFAAVLALAVGTYLRQAPAQAAGPAETIAVSLSPSSIVADGVSSSRVTATLSFPLPGQTVVFSSTDSGIRLGPTIDNLNGTYTATLTSSTTAGTPTITATSSWMGQQISGSASLTQTPGPAKNMTLSVEPRSIVAGGTSYAVATATVTDAYGNPVSTDAVAFSSTDPLEEVIGVASGGNGTYRALIRSSTTPGEAVITATDTTANLSVSSELSQTGGAKVNQTAAGSLLSLVSAQWTFQYNPVYTMVRSLIVIGVPVGSRLLVGCHGRGCPFTTRLIVIGAGAGCASTSRWCGTDRTIDLTREFKRSRLHVRTRVTVLITRPQWIGKYYAFTTRASRPPSVRLACLAPGATHPGASC
ncbi:MAG: Ig-like domain-containing protein [Solirubrobacteraceae bacterium]